MTTAPSADALQRDDARLYLRGDLKAEPLINGWYAWAFLVSPISFALVTRNLHLRVLESYLKSPKLHAQAVHNQDLKGGLFVDYAGDIDTMRRFVEQSRTGLADLVEFAADLQAFDTALQAEADGDLMAPWYARLPAALRGRVELLYDLHGHPKLRFIEPLFYASPLYRPELQSICLSLMDGDLRPFVLSSPRLPDGSGVSLQWPFADARWDALFAMRHTPMPAAQFRALVGWDGLGDAERSLLATFVTEAAPTRGDMTLAAGEVQLRYFGHATVLMRSNEVSVLTDPIVAYPVDGAVARYSFQDLPDHIDYVVLTHNHQDHVMFETLLQLRHRIGTIVVPRGGSGTLPDLSLKLTLQAIGFANVIELAELETLPIPGGRILGVPFLGEHGDLELQTKLAFHVRIGATSAMFAADSDNLDPAMYPQLQPLIGAVDHLFLGMECVGAPLSWVYGPLFVKPPERKHDQARRLNGSDAERAWGIVEALQPGAVHVYAMGSEPWLAFISSIEYESDSPPIVESNRLIARCNDAGIPASRLYGRHEIRVALPDAAAMSAASDTVAEPA